MNATKTHISCKKKKKKYEEKVIFNFVEMSKATAQKKM